MITIIVIGAVTALAMFAVLLKLSAAQPKRAEKTEKGEIIKQLLALSELEERTSKTAGRPAPPRAENPARQAKSPQPKPSKNASECVGL